VEHLKSASLYHKHETRLERPARGKYSSLIKTFVNYRRKKFYNIGYRGLYHKIFYSSVRYCFLSQKEVTDKYKDTTLLRYRISYGHS
jgi:hypothetical protein